MIGKQKKVVDFYKYQVKNLKYVFGGNGDGTHDDEDQPVDDRGNENG